MADRDAYIVSACRTAIGEFLGGLSPLRAPELGAVVIREAVSRAGIEPALAEEVLMGNAAELIARKFKVTREDQDRFSVESHQKAVRAQKEGKFKDEIVPVLVPQKKGEPKCFCVDERPRPDTTMESLAKLKPAFEKDGTVTAANAPGLNDGASAVVVMSGAAVKRTHAKPMARVTGY